MKSLFLAAVAAIGFLSLQAQPPHAKAHGKRAKQNQQVVVVPGNGPVLARSKKPKKVKYYYYPQQGIYLNTSSRQYAFWDGSRWITTNRRPRTFVATATPQTIYYENPQIWTTMPAPSGLTININR